MSNCCLSIDEHQNDLKLNKVEFKDKVQYKSNEGSGQSKEEFKRKVKVKVQCKSN